MTRDAWLAVFKQFGTRLPTDFVEYHNVWGEGYFSSRTHERTASLHLWGGASNFMSFGSNVPEQLSELRGRKEARPNAIQLPLYWEPGGLLPWGKASNDTHLCWRVRGTLVDDWPVVVLRPASRTHELFECSAIEFIARVLNGSIASELLPKHFPGLKGACFKVWKFGPDGPEDAE